MVASPAPRFHGLDMLRGTAAILCMLYHVQMEFKVGSGPFLMGFLAVDLFYAASGYVMARSFASRRSAGGGLGDFVAGRFRRLWLPYAVGCLLGAAVVLRAGWDPARVFPSLALMLLFLPSPFIGKGVFGLNSPGWTLTFQMAADILHRLAFSRMGTRSLLALWVVCTGVFWFWTLETLWLWAGTSFGHFAYCVFRTLVPYLSGILIFRLLRDRTFAVPWWVAQAGLPLLILGGQALPQPLFQMVFVVLFCPLLIVASFRFADNEQLCRFASWLGSFSYPLFAVHMPVLHLFRDNGWPREGAAVASILLGIAVTAAVKRLPPGWPFVVRRPAAA